MIQITNDSGHLLFGDKDADCPGQAHFNRCCLARADFTPFSKGGDCAQMQLAGCKLVGANFRGLDISGSNFEAANLHFADLSDCDLTDCYFSRTDLRNVKLKGSQLNWDSHDLLVHILSQHAREAYYDRSDTPGDLESKGRFQEYMERLQFAGAISLSPMFCWRDYLRMAHSQKNWAAKTLYSHLTQKELAADLCDLQQGAFILRRAVEYGEFGYTDPDTDPDESEEENNGNQGLHGKDPLRGSGC